MLAFFLSRPRRLVFYDLSGPETAERLMMFFDQFQALHLFHALEPDDLNPVSRGTLADEQDERRIEMAAKRLQMVGPTIGSASDEFGSDAGDLRRAA